MAFLDKNNMFEEFRDAQGNLISSINRDGSMFVQEIKYSDGTSQATAIASSSPYLSVKSFGAVGNGIADDTSAIQTAINAGLATGQAVFFPSGTYLISSTLICFSGTQGAVLIGVTGIGSGASIIKYSGTGTALSFNNAGAIIYTPVIRNLVIQSTGSADKGICFNNVSESILDTVTIGGDASSFFNTCFYAQQSGDITSIRMTASYCNTGVWLDSISGSTALLSYQIFFYNGSYYACAEACFKINAATGIFFDGNFIENVQYGFEFNDAGNNDSGFAQLVQCEHIFISATRLLLNDPVVGTYAVRYPMFVNGVSGKKFIANNILFNDNSVFVAAVSSPDVAYPFQFALDPATNASSVVTTTLSGNMVHGQLTGIYESNNSKIDILLFNNKQLSKTGTVLTAETDSSSALTANSIKSTSGTVEIGNNNSLTGITLAVQDNTTSTGVTQVLLSTGPNQSTIPIMNLANQVAATGANTQSDPPTFELSGNYWTGSVSAVGSIQWTSHFGTGASPSVNLTALMTGLQSTTYNAAFKNSSLAISSQNCSVPAFALIGSFWNGSAAAQETWQFNHTIGSGANPTSKLSVLHTGSTGVATLDFSNIDGTGASMSVILPGTTIKGSAPTVEASQLGLGADTTTSATAGGNGDVPNQVVGYLTVNIAGTLQKIPYYNT